MTWVKFSDRKPENKKPLITRCTPWDKKGDAFEDWREWNNDYIRTIKAITHWWDGEYDFDEAVEEWKKINPDI